MSLNAKRVLAILAALGLGTSVLASMDAQKAMKTKYPDFKANCATCHAKSMPKKGDSELNAYGKDLGKNLDFAGIESKDSDGDGKSNLDEIKAGTNPGAK